MTLTLNKPSPHKACLACSLVKSGISQLAERTRLAITRTEIQYVAKATYQMPDSHHCQKALDLVIEYSPAHLVNHCLRTYAFGTAMAHKVRQKYDPEVFFLGAIMHDLGLTEHFDTGETFEVDGARAAHDFCVAHGLDQYKADLVHEIVVHHNSIGRAHKMAPEVALVHYGAGADVAGFWLHDLNPRTLSEILNEYPRLNFKEGMSKLLKDQMARKPNSYMAPMVQLGFLDKVKQATFDS